MIKRVIYWAFVFILLILFVYCYGLINSGMTEPIDRTIGPHTIVSLEYPDFSLSGKAVFSSTDAFVIKSTSGELLPQPIFNEPKAGETTGKYILSSDFNGRYTVSNLAYVSIYTLEDGKIQFYKSADKIAWGRISTALLFLIIWFFISYQAYKLL